MAASVHGLKFDSGVVDAAEVEERLDTLDRIHAFVRLSGEREIPDSTLTLHYAFVNRSDFPAR